jgi:hypothetical protein
MAAQDVRIAIVVANAKFERDLPTTFWIILISPEVDKGA